MLYGEGPCPPGHLEAVWLDFEQNVEVEDVIGIGRTLKLSAISHRLLHTLFSMAQTPPSPAQVCFLGNPKDGCLYRPPQEKNGKIGFLLLVNNVVKGAGGSSRMRGLRHTI